MVFFTEVGLEMVQGSHFYNVGWYTKFDLNNSVLIAWLQLFKGLDSWSYSVKLIKFSYCLKLGAWSLLLLTSWSLDAGWKVLWLLDWILIPVVSIFTGSVDVTTLVANIRWAQQWVCGGCGIAGWEKDPWKNVRRKWSRPWYLFSM